MHRVKASASETWKLSVHWPIRTFNFKKTPITRLHHLSQRQKWWVQRLSELQKVSPIWDAAGSSLPKEIMQKIKIKKHLNVLDIQKCLWLNHSHPHIHHMESLSQPHYRSFWRHSDLWFFRGSSEKVSLDKRRIYLEQTMYFSFSLWCALMLPASGAAWRYRTHVQFHYRMVTGSLFFFLVSFKTFIFLSFVHSLRFSGLWFSTSEVHHWSGWIIKKQKWTRPKPLSRFLINPKCKQRTLYTKFYSFICWGKWFRNNWE